MTDINRRNILTVAAWSIPAITLAGAAPAYATSTEPELPPLECEPKGNRSSRISKVHKVWDYHLKPGCTDEIECVWIAGIAADYEQTNKRWSVPDFDWDTIREQEVHVQTKDGRVWKGGVSFR